MKPYLLVMLLLILVVLIVLIFAETDQVSEECSEDIYNCDNFTTQSEAQIVFNKCPTDVYHLDNNKDGVACESLS